MDYIWAFFLLLMGGCVGSFLNVVVWRLPRGQSIVFPASHCPKCGRAIFPRDNIPVLGWIILGGKCRFCKCPISIQYPLIEALTAILVAGLFVCYYIINVRTGAGYIEDTWPMYAAHATLICVLLACSIIDLQSWMVPLEVCWFATIVGFISATASPHPFMPEVAPKTGIAAVGAAIGLIIASVLLYYRIILPSFIDAAGRPLKHPKPADDAEQPPASNSQTATPAAQENASDANLSATAPAIDSQTPAANSAAVAVATTNTPAVYQVAATKDHGINPRIEILREVSFLAIPLATAMLAVYLANNFAPVERFWNWMTGDAQANPFAPHFNGFLSALTGYLVGGLWVWGARILGTLGFNKEAMGMGDVHILAAVGAVTGWVVPSITFFLAPIFALAWGIILVVRKGQRELPYGPWLAVAALVTMLAYDKFLPYLGTVINIFSGGGAR